MGGQTEPSGSMHGWWDTYAKAIIHRGRGELISNRYDWLKWFEESAYQPWMTGVLQLWPYFLVPPAQIGSGN
ncbi:hypothetical protein Y1Q_0011052 [Alligator mississippiensis]|uniref:Uncharacterized protein n=1 Tax=Alligator mississippiensis TaxID=8496 RepID=A0A151NWC8_ALLMI|nr:hypothetical protein Y1Q_0011052 [Alligator mississippiensis]